MQARIAILVLLLAAAGWSADWDSLKQAGDEALKSKDYAAAVSQFEKLVDAFPERAAAHNALGFAYYMNGQFEPAEKQFEAVLAREANNAAAQRNLLMVGGRLALEMDYEQAISKLDRLARRFPKNPELVALSFYRGKLHFLNGRTDLGLAAWQEVARARPQSATADFLTGLEAHRRGALDQARPLYEKALEKMSDEVVWVTYLAALLYEQGHPDWGLALADPFLADNPGYAHLQVLASKLDQNRALRILTKASEWGLPGAQLQMGARLLGVEIATARREINAAFGRSGAPAVVVLGDSATFMWIDDFPLGPPPIGWFVNPGTHRLLARNPNRAPSTREFSVAADSLKLARITSAIELLDRPRKADLVPAR